MDQWSGGWGETGVKGRRQGPVHEEKRAKAYFMPGTAITLYSAYLCLFPAKGSGRLQTLFSRAAPWSLLLCMWRLAHSCFYWWMQYTVLVQLTWCIVSVVGNADVIGRPADPILHFWSRRETGWSQCSCHGWLWACLSAMWIEKLFLLALGRELRMHWLWTSLHQCHVDISPLPEKQVLAWLCTNSTALLYGK